ATRQRAGLAFSKTCCDVYPLVDTWVAGSALSFASTCATRVFTSAAAVAAVGLSASTRSHACSRSFGTFVDALALTVTTGTGTRSRSCAEAAPERKRAANAMAAVDRPIMLLSFVRARAGPG